MHTDVVVTGLVLLFGLAVGSFLNVVIYRLPRGKKIVLDRSACPHCGRTIPFYHNIPVISFILLGGKCRFCREQISWRYPLVEIVNGALYLLFFHLDGLILRLPFHFFLASTLVAIFFIDLEFQIIPDKITLPSLAIGLIGALIAPPPGIAQALIGAVVGGGGLLLVAYLGEWLFKKEAMGGGDIKMAAMMGAFVGWQKVLLIFMGGAFIGMIVSLVWMAVSKKIRQERLIPFGPFLALAALMAVVYGDQIIRFYLGTFLH